MTPKVITDYVLVYRTRVNTTFDGDGFYRDVDKAEKVCDALRETLCNGEDPLIKWITVVPRIS